jgi:pimeloyl-ACP methyl ester carboxylesterase
LRLATRFAQRVARVRVLNSVWYDSWLIEAMLQLGASPNVVPACCLRTTLLRQALKQGFATSPDTEVLDGLLAPYTTEASKHSLIRAVSARNTNLTTEITPLLGEIVVPTLILWSEDDVWQPLKYGERLAWDIGAHN